MAQREATRRWLVAGFVAVLSQGGPDQEGRLQVFVEPQFTIVSRGAGQPELQIFIGVNTQFVKR
jgi:hypothetical protein